MPGPRDLTDVAIDSALHRLPEPKSSWRGLTPPEDLGAMVDAGSGQITLQALIACLHYGPAPYSVRALHRYADLCWKRFMLSEPWSAIYGEAIVCCWVAVVLLAERIGETALAGRFRALLSAWAATSRLMEARAGGKTYVLSAGCRSWGHEESASGLSAIWNYAAGRATPPPPGSKKYGTPGAYDDWGWLVRAESLGLPVLRAAAAPWPAEMPLARLLETAPRWSARTEMQLLGWADGSRLWLMGDDEATMDDEDANGNTPGWLAAGVLGGRIVALPDWPNPADGATRLRQTNCRADLDGTPEKGWTLWHSHLGERRGAHPATGASGFLSHLPPWQGAPLLFHVAIPALAGEWRLLAPAAIGAGEETGELPAPIFPVPLPGPADRPALRLTWLPSSAEWLLECDEAPVDLREIHGDPPNWPRRWIVTRRPAA